MTLKFRKIRGKEIWYSTTNQTSIRKTGYLYHPEGKRYCLHDGHTQFDWFSTLEEAKEFANNNWKYNR